MAQGPAAQARFVAGGSYDEPDEFDNVILTGLAAADGMLFVPAGPRLVAY